MKFQFTNLEWRWKSGCLGINSNESHYHSSSGQFGYEAYDYNQYGDVQS